jgi:hypothetical protein
MIRSKSDLAFKKMLETFYLQAKGFPQDLGCLLTFAHGSRAAGTHKVLWDLTAALPRSTQVWSGQ